MKAELLKPCDIFHVASQGSFAWKWRHRLADGRVIESTEKYPLYYECVLAALQRGYQPNVKCIAPGDGAIPRIPL